MATTNVAMLPHPAVKAILLCERTIRDSHSGSATLVGLVDDISAPAFPFVYARGLELYVRVIDVAGKYETRIEVVSVVDGQTIAGVNGVAAMPNRRRAYELIFDFERLPFERPGEYEFRFFANGRFVASAVLLVGDAE